jgi:hypothetical protein
MQPASSVCRAVTGHKWETSNASSNPLAERTGRAHRPEPEGVRLTFWHLVDCDHSTSFPTVKVFMNT